MNRWEPYPLPDLAPSDRSPSTEGGCLSNPVVIATGNKVEFETDFQTANDDGLDLVRSYNHYWSGRGTFGDKWLTNHDYQIVYSDYEAGACTTDGIGLQTCDEKRANTIVAWRPDGRRLQYTKAADETYRSADAPSNTYMQFNADGQLIYTAENRDVETYEGSFFGGTGVKKRTDIRGNTWAYEYMVNVFLTRVTYDSGRYIEFQRDINTLQVNSVRDPAGNYHTYGYKSLGNGAWILASHAQAGAGISVAYHYEDPDYRTALTGKSYNGVRYSTFGYDATGRVSSSEHAGSVEKSIFSYSFSDGELCDASGCYSSTSAATQVTSPLGKITSYNFENGRQVSMVGSPSTYCPYSSALTTYDPNNRVDRTTDAKGIVTDQDYDANGRLIKTTQALGTPEERSTTLVWEPARDRLLSSTLWKGTTPIARTERAYTIDNRIASIRQVDLTGTGISGQAYLTTYAYTKHPNGVLATVTVDGPVPGSADAGIARFNSYGDLIAEENGLGHVVTYSGHNGLGLPGRRVGANGDVTDYIYDALGRVTKIRSYPNGVAADITYTYTAAQLASVQTPDGQTRTREYDAAWRVIRESELEPTGTYAVTRYTYNNASLVTSVVTERTGEPDAPPVPPAPAAPPISTTSASGSSGSHTITWGAIGNADYYVLEESIDGGAWTQVYSGSDLSWSAAGRIPGTYRYRIKACAANGGCSVDPSIVTVMVTPNIVPILYELLLD